MSKIKTKYNSTNINKDFFNNFSSLLEKFNNEVKQIKQLGGLSAVQKQHDKGKLVVRERISHLIDENTLFFELSKFAAYGMYKEYGSCPAAGVITGVCKIHGKDFMIIANDATVKAGAYFEVTLKKTLRAQEIAIKNNIPIIYLVDSAGVFLPLQDQVFADEGHFGKIFYNNARLSANGNIQIASVMGPCVAGGAYLPVMCDKYVMTKGSSMFLAGPALVKAAVGQEIDAESLGGSKTHSRISGIVDYKAKNDQDALNRIRALVEKIGDNPKAGFNRIKSLDPGMPSDEIYELLPNDKSQPYDTFKIIERVVDNGSIDEYKADYGKTLITLYARVDGWAVGIVANQRKIVKNKKGELQFGGVIYGDSADKATRFIGNCNQRKIPLSKNSI